MAEKLWKYQLIRYKGLTYSLTRLGFRLTLALKIMATILKTIPAKADKVKRVTNSHIDDILVDKSTMLAKENINHSKCFGLTANPPEAMEGGAAL